MLLSNMFPIADAGKYELLDFSGYDNFQHNTNYVYGEFVYEMFIQPLLIVLQPTRQGIQLLIIHHNL